MTLCTSELKQKSHELFSPEMEKEVLKSINTDLIRQNTNPENKANQSPDGMVSKSLNPFDAFSFLEEKYDSISTGKFNNLPRLYWNNRDNFIFSFDEDAPFSFEMSNGTLVTPQRMETNGGSIPRILHLFSKFSPWGYAPAFILHDWIFSAKRCGYEPFASWSLEDAADLMAESMKTLMEVGYVDFDGNRRIMEKSELTLLMMRYAVVTGKARDLWENAPTNCY